MRWRAGVEWAAVHTTPPFSTRLTSTRLTSTQREVSEVRVWFFDVLLGAFDPRTQHSVEPIASPSARSSIRIRMK